MRDPRGVQEIDGTQRLGRVSWRLPERDVEVVRISIPFQFGGDHHHTPQYRHRIRPRKPGEIGRVIGELVRDVRGGHDNRRAVDIEKQTATDMLGS